MSSYSNLSYSDDLCSAFMAAIVAAFQEQYNDSKYLGRTAMQKLVYFSKVLGVPIPCSFEIYTYGPYSDRVTFSVDSLMADDVLVDKSQNSRYSNYRLGPNAQEILAKYGAAVSPHIDKLQAVVTSLGSFEPTQLELIATLHFIYHRLRQIKLEEPSRDEVITEFRRVKGDKFAQGEIDSFHDALDAAGLMQHTRAITSTGVC